MALLLEYAGQIDGVERLRYTTSHPLEMHDSLIELYRPLPQLVGHLHLPVQSGSDRILQAMKRGHDVDYYLSIIRKLRRARPGMTFSTDLIVGFPGESEEDFSRTLELVRTVGFDHSYSFIYSPRPGTPAAELRDSVSEGEKKDRLQRLHQELQQTVDRVSADMVGTRRTILVEGRSKRREHELFGKTENNRTVNFSGDLALIGELVEVEITERRPNSLRGDLVSEVPAPRCPITAASPCH